MWASQGLQQLVLAVLQASITVHPLRLFLGRAASTLPQHPTRMTNPIRRILTQARLDPSSSILVQTLRCTALLLLPLLLDLQPEPAHTPTFLSTNQATTRTPG